MTLGKSVIHTSVQQQEKAKENVVHVEDEL